MAVTWEPGLGLMIVDENGVARPGGTALLQGGIGTALGLGMGGAVAGGRGAAIGGMVGAGSGAAGGALAGVLQRARDRAEQRRTAAMLNGQPKTSGAHMQFVSDRLASRILPTQTKQSEDSNAQRNALIAGLLAGGGAAAGAGAGEDALHRALGATDFEELRYNGAMAGKPGAGGNWASRTLAKAKGGLADSGESLAGALEGRRYQRALAGPAKGLGAWAARHRVGLRGAAGVGAGLSAAGLAALLSGNGGQG